MSDPANVYALDDIRTITGRDVQPVVATANDVERAIQKFAGHGLAGRGAWRASSPSRPRRRGDRPRGRPRGRADRQARERDHDPGGRGPRLRRPPRARRRRTSGSASASTACCTSRCRPAPKNIQGGLISRLKVMADLNIAEKRVPQDGRISMKVGGKAARPPCRDPARRCTARRSSSACSTSRTRCCGSRTSGSSRTSYDRFSRVVPKPYGAILVTGPTGSGKSTTMYSTLNILNEEDKNIITVEDPVEYRLAGREPDPGEPEGGAHLRERAALDPARRPRHRADR